jgi:nucleoside diphosphate kinase
VSAGCRVYDFKEQIRKAHPKINEMGVFILLDSKYAELHDVVFLYESKMMMSSISPLLYLKVDEKLDISYFCQPACPSGAIYYPIACQPVALTPSLLQMAQAHMTVQIPVALPMPAPNPTPPEPEIYEEDEYDDTELNHVSLKLEHELAMLSMNSSKLGGVPTIIEHLFQPLVSVKNGFANNIKYSTAGMAQTIAKNMLEVFEEHASYKRKAGETGKTPQTVLLARSLFTVTKSVNDLRFFEPHIEPVKALLLEGIVGHRFIEELPFIDNESTYVNFLTVMRSSFAFILKYVHKLKPHLQRFICYHRQFWPKMCFRVNDSKEVLAYVRTFGEVLLNQLKEDGINNSPKSFLKQAKVVLTVVSGFQGWNVNANAICNTDAFTKEFDSALRAAIRGDYGTLTSKNRVIESTLTPKEREDIRRTLFSLKFTHAHNPVRTMQLQLWIAYLTSTTCRGFQSGDSRFCNMYGHALQVNKLYGKKHYSTPCLVSCDLPFNKSSGSDVTHLVSVDHLHVCYDVGFMFTAYLFQLARCPMDSKDNTFFWHLSAYMESILESETPQDPKKIPEWYSRYIFGKPLNWKLSNRESIEDLFRILLTESGVDDKDRLSYLFRNTGIQDAMARNVPNDQIGQTACHSNFDNSAQKFYAKGGVTNMVFVNAERGSLETFHTHYDFLFDTSMEYEYGLSPFYNQDDTLPYQRDLSSFPDLEWIQLPKVPKSVLSIFFPGLITLLELRFQCATKQVNPYVDFRIDNLLRLLLYKGIPQFFSRLDEIYAIHDDGSVNFTKAAFSIAAINNVEFQYACADKDVKSFLRDLVEAKRNHFMLSTVLQMANGDKDEEFRKTYERVKDGCAAFMGKVPVLNSNFPSTEAIQVPNVASINSAPAPAHIPVQVPENPFKDWKCKVGNLEHGSFDIQPFFKSAYRPSQIYYFWCKKPEGYEAELEGRLSLKDYDKKQHDSNNKPGIIWKDVLFNPSIVSSHTQIYAYTRQCCMWFDSIKFNEDNTKDVEERFAYIKTLTEQFNCNGSKPFFLMLAIIQGFCSQAVNIGRYKQFLGIYERYKNGTNDDKIVFHNFDEEKQQRFDRLAAGVRVKLAEQQQKKEANE